MGQSQGYRPSQERGQGFYHEYAQEFIEESLRYKIMKNDTDIIPLFFCLLLFIAVLAGGAIAAIIEGLTLWLA